MEPFKPKGTKKGGPEAILQEGIVNRLQAIGWYTKVTYGNELQSGFPDLFVAHRLYGQKWVEVKNPLQYSFTPAQLIEFPRMTAAGVGIWILTGFSDDHIKKLLKPANWQEYYMYHISGVKPPM